MNIKIALLQIVAHPLDQTSNLTKGIDYCHKAQVLGADIIVFPEMWNVGYALANPKLQQNWQRYAIDENSDFIISYKATAKQLSVAIAITYLEKTPAGPCNSVSLIDMHGDIIFTYRKVHTCKFSHEKLLVPGNEFIVKSLETKYGELNVGAMICFDREFPESARELTLQNVELILVPNACPLDHNRLAQLQGRAFESMAAIAMTNYPEPEFNGKSIVYDGMAYNKDGCARDMVRVAANEEEGIYISDLDIAALREYRQHEVWGSKHRRPSAYHGIINHN